jgi:hypothetical protein
MARDLGKCHLESSGTITSLVLGDKALRLYAVYRRCLSSMSQLAGASYQSYGFPNCD